MEMLGAITGLIGAGLSASNNAAQQTIQWANLQFQKQQAAKQLRFAQAGRTDAYGNKQKFNDLTNEWEMALTPIQKQITTAGEQEQLRSLTEDAQRNRRQKERAEDTALLAGKEFNRALAGYRYDQPHSEAAIRDELESLMLTNNAQQAKDNQGIIARQALRMGKGADYARIIKATDDELGQNLTKTMLQARQGALTERANKVQQHESQYLPAMQNWEQLMAQGGGDAQLRFSNVPQELAAQQNAMAAGISQAMNSAASNIGGAYNALGTAVGKPVDLSGVSKAFSGGTSGGKGVSGSTKYSLTAKSAPAQNSDVTRGNSAPWDQDIPWSHAGDYLSGMDYGDWLF